MERQLLKSEQVISCRDQLLEELPPGAKPFELTDFSGISASTEAPTLRLDRDMQLDLKIQLGRTHMRREEALALKNGSVVPLDKLAGDAVDIYVKGRLFARGEVLVLNENVGVRITELVAAEVAA